MMKLSLWIIIFGKKVNKMEFKFKMKIIKMKIKTIKK